MLSRIRLDLLPADAIDALKEKHAVLESLHDAYEATEGQPEVVRRQARVKVGEAQLLLSDQYRAYGKGLTMRIETIAASWRNDASKEIRAAFEETLAGNLQTCVSIFCGEDFDTPTDTSPNGPVKDSGFAQMKAPMTTGGGEQIEDVPTVVKCLNKLMKAGNIQATLPETTRTEELATKLTEAVMQYLKRTKIEDSATIAQMGATLTPAIRRRAAILEHYELYTRASYRPYVALRMARNVVDKKR